MANTAGICNSFKFDLLQGIHNFGTGVIRAGTTKDTFKAALYLASASLDRTTTSYTTTGEVSGVGYTAGGGTDGVITNTTAPTVAVTTSSTTAYWTPSASIVYNTVTLSTAFDSVLIYNSTNSNRSVGIWSFGSQTITAGNFTLTMPANDASNGLLRIT
jgi:hypothetical protein